METSNNKKGGKKIVDYLRRKLLNYIFLKNAIRYYDVITDVINAVQAERVKVQCNWKFVGKWVDANPRINPNV